MVQNGTVRMNVQGSELDQVLIYLGNYTAFDIGFVLSSCTRSCLLRDDLRMTLAQALDVKGFAHALLKSGPWQTVLAAALKSLVLSAEQPLGHSRPGPLDRP